LVSRYKAEGYEFVTIPEMMKTVVSRQLSVIRGNADLRL
jgi:hypothetical protein